MVLQTNKTLHAGTLFPGQRGVERISRRIDTASGEPLAAGTIGEGTTSGPRECARRPSSALLGACALALALCTGTASAQCVKKVFNQFCLGGSGASLPAGAESQPSDDGEVFRFDDRGRAVYALVANDRVTRVWREEVPGSWINYLEWRNKLIRVYGRGEEVQDFPPSAKSRSARHNAVVGGEGQAYTQWDQDGWQVRIIWNSPSHVQLSYRLTGEQDDAGGNSEGL